MIPLRFITHLQLSEEESLYPKQMDIIHIPHIEFKFSFQQAIAFLPFICAQPVIQVSLHVGEPALHCNSGRYFTSKGLGPINDISPFSHLEVEVIHPMK
jgi:hypothetical protein